MIRLKPYLIALIAILAVGCGGIKPGGASKGTNLYETFYFGEEGTQFFIKPFAIKGEDGKELLFDMTFRYKDVLKDSAVVNFSIIGPTVIKHVSRITIDNGSMLVEPSAIELLFNEVEKKGYESRFVCKVAMVDLRPLFKSSRWTVKIQSKSESLTFETNGKSVKTIEQLDGSLFTLTD